MDTQPSLLTPKANMPSRELLCIPTSLGKRAPWATPGPEGRVSKDRTRAQTPTILQPELCSSRGRNQEDMRAQGPFPATCSLGESLLPIRKVPLSQRRPRCISVWGHLLCRSATTKGSVHIARRRDVRPPCVSVGE